MYALLVFTLGWPAPEPINTYPRIEVCQAVKMQMVSQLADVEGFDDPQTKALRCVRMASLGRPHAEADAIAAVHVPTVK